MKARDLIKILETDLDAEVDCFDDRPVYDARKVEIIGNQHFILRSEQSILDSKREDEMLVIIAGSFEGGYRVVLNTNKRPFRDMAELNEVVSESTVNLIPDYCAVRAFTL